jgi:hypothetical protein
VAKLRAFVETSQPRTRFGRNAATELETCAPHRIQRRLDGVVFEQVAYSLEQRIEVEGFLENDVNVVRRGHARRVARRRTDRY